MPLSLTILVGTMTGTAELVAEEIQNTLEDAGHRVEVKLMDGLDADVFGTEGQFLIVTSTYGQGDVPDNSRHLMESLQGARPDLAGIRFGIIALGDRTYAATYCRGGKRFDEELRALGAQRVGDMLMHDASSGTMPEEVAVEWIVPWAAQFEEAAA